MGDEHRGRVSLHREGRIFYGWYIALAGSGSNFLILGITLFGFGVFIEPIREEFGWSARAIGIGFAIRSFEQGFLSPITGYLIDRLGSRRMAVAGVTILSLGLLLFSQIQNLWLYYTASLILALGQSLGAFTPFSLAIVNWFSRKRGRAMGLMHSGNGLGYAAALILAALIGAFGWRETLIIAAAAVFTFGIPLAMVLRSRPEAYGYLPDGERIEKEHTTVGYPGIQAQPTAKAASLSTGMTVSQALRTPAFYLLALSHAMGSVAQITWIVFQIPHLESAGFSLGAAGLFVAIYGGVQVVLRFGAGWLGDVIGRRRMYIASYLLQAVGLWIFSMLSPSRLWLLPAYYLTYALGHASWIVLGQAVVADYFGTKRFATIRGLVQTMQVPGGVAGPIFAGWMFDRNGTYAMAFVVVAIICATGAIWLLLIRRPQWNNTPSADQPAYPAARPAKR